MSEFKFSCPHCDQHILCDEQLSGREIHCPNCQHLFQVPPVPGKPGQSSPESGRNLLEPPQRPPDAWVPQPIAVQPLPLQNKLNSPTRWEVPFVILVSLAMVVTDPNGG